MTPLPVIEVSATMGRDDLITATWANGKRVRVRLHVSGLRPLPDGTGVSSEVQVVGTDCVFNSKLARLNKRLTGMNTIRVFGAIRTHDSDLHVVTARHEAQHTFDQRAMGLGFWTAYAVELFTPYSERWLERRAFYAAGQSEAVPLR